MNALLSMSNISNELIMACRFHGAAFDVTTGRKVREPNLTLPQEMEPLPEKWQKFMEYIGQLMSHIKTYGDQVCETRVEGS